VEDLISFHFHSRCALFRTLPKLLAL